MFSARSRSFLNGAAATLASSPLLPSVGVTPSHTTFSMHALLVDHYIKGAFYPRGGASEIAFHTIPVIQRAGGAVLTKASVQSVLLDSAGKACGESLAACFMGPGLAWESPGLQGKKALRARGVAEPTSSWGLKAGVCRRAGLGESDSSGGEEDEGRIKDCMVCKEQSLIIYSTDKNSYPVIHALLE